MTPLVVIDPALGRTGAHNLAFADLLAAHPGFGDIGYCGNVAMDDALQERLARRAGLVAKVFDVDFYALAGRSGGVHAHWAWIHALSEGYVAAFDRVLARWPGQPVRLLHHTLSWEHATALSSAIARLGARGAGLQHVALAMYSPGVDAAGRTLDVARRLDFRLAFAGLLASGRVLAYAGCSEHAAAYRHLLGLAADLQVHPAIVGDWHRAPADGRGRVPGRVLMYAGEIKQDKGFLDLPRRLRDALAGAPASARFVLQFAAIRTDAARAVVEELRAIAAAHPGVELHPGYWSPAELEAELQAAELLRLDYDPIAYAHKSSGLLWLAAWHGLAVAAPAGSWLEREAHRLGVSLAPSPSAAGDAPPRRLRRRDDGYFRTLFTPLDTWLRTLPSPVAPPVRAPGERVRAALAAPRPTPPPPRPGVDVVMFWKQHDSTLYGRRSDMIARHLAAHPDIGRVVMIDAPLDAQRLAGMLADDDARRHDRRVGERVLEKLAGRHDAPGPVPSHALYVHPRGDGRSVDPQDRPDPAFLADYEAWLRGELAHRGIDPQRAVFWIHPRNFSLPPLLARLRPWRVVVDIVDDHRAWPGLAPAEKARLTAHYRELLGVADLALVNCEPVRAAMAALGRSPLLVPNGCDAPLPVRLDETDAPLREHLAFAGRTLGFVGNLEAKIDIELLGRVAEAFPDCRVVLIGSTHANPEVATLARHDNVRLPGPVPYDRLGAWLSRFDVGLVPHRRMELTEYMNPLKAYVYLANGIPVVATGVPNIEAVPDLVDIAPDHDGFIAAIASRLARGRPAPAAFDAATSPRRWAARLDPVLDVLLQGAAHR